MRSNRHEPPITPALATTLYLYCSLFHFLIIPVQAYIPVDLFSISCGSSGNSSHDERTWIGDIDSKLLSPVDTQDGLQASVTAKPLTQSSSANEPPYFTARLSRYEFAYSFPVTNGPKFVRLFFYPTSYQQGFDRSKAFFTVKSRNLTLLKDFNASLTADADEDPGDTIFREYCINVNDGDKLNLTFTPSTEHQDSYAFINGIEVVSMPTYLYYTEHDDPGFELVNSTNFLYSIKNNSALETVYRLNVGGRTLSPSQDTGMLRSWVGDNDYVTSHSALPAEIGDVNLSFTQIPNYTAPIEMYLKARSMGTNGTQNAVSNLSWAFLVDSGFTYMLRLHFCELDPHINAGEDRVFHIYICELLAEEDFSVLASSKGKGVPIYKDYAVFVLGNQNKANLTLKMSPETDSRISSYLDAFLNGVEIFKISDPHCNNLAGPNPDSLLQIRPNSQQRHPDSKECDDKTLIIAGVVCGVVLLLMIVFLVIRHRKKLKAFNSEDGTSTSTNLAGSYLPSHLCRKFSMAEINAATNNFQEMFIIGVGGFGHVYKGYIDDGSTPVAIKRLKGGSQQGSQEFLTEIEMLSQLRHLHLVSLIGYCNDSNEMILVYEYMARGTLRDHIYDTDNEPLPWKQLLQICIGAAQGLQYLHTGVKHNIIHRDVKSTNILLDEKWVAKVSDFGLSKVGPGGISRSHLTTVVKGSLGYLDPEYYMRQRLTQKCDVYAFGVVLLEVVCGRPPLMRSADKQQASIVEWARKCHGEGTVDQMVDPSLKGSTDPECLKKFIDLALSCLDDDGNQRPSMNGVVWGLEFALQLQESAEDGVFSGETGNEESVLLNQSYHS